MPNRDQKRGTNGKTGDRQRNRPNEQPDAERKRQGNGARPVNKGPRNRGA